MNRTGICRVTGADLAAAGVALDQIAADKVALSCQGEPVACRIIGAENGSFGQQSAVLFYGEALDTRYTDTNMYWLSWENEPGPRMKPLELGADTARPADTFAATAHFEENKQFAMLYSEFLPGDDSLNPWFWMVARTGQPAETPLQLPALSPSAEKIAVRTMVRGRTSSLEHDPDHHVRVSVGGAPLGEATFDGQAEALIEGEINAQPFRAGEVTLRIEVVGDTATGDRDQIYLDWVECTYARTFAADDGRLAFQLEAGPSRKVTVEGLAEGIAEVYRISDGRAAEYAAAGAVGAGRVSLSLGGEQAQSYLVTTPAAYLEPAYVQTVQPSALRATDQGADLIIIAHDELVEAVRPLAEYRANQGLRVRMVPVSEIYDTFSHGVFTPHAIRSFLRYTYREWRKPAPRYVLLVGDANYDYRGYLGTGEANFVPAYSVPVRRGIETPSDAYYTCVADADNVPEMAIGRLPARTREQAARYCERIVAYEQSAPAGEWRKQALVVADHELPATEATWFEIASAQDARLCEAFGMQVTPVFLRAAGVSPDLGAEENRKLVREKATPLALAALNQGCSLFLFQGHGAANFLGRQHVIDSTDLNAVENGGRSPLGILVTCFAGAFDDPECEGGECLAERLLNAPSGAIACIAPTRLGGLNIEFPLLAQLLNAPQTPLGEALAVSKDALLARKGNHWEPTENYNLLGDPLLLLGLDIKAPPPPAAVADAAAEDRVSDANGNGLSDALEQHIATGSHRRYGLPGSGLTAVFCAMARAPTEADVEVVANLGGQVLAVCGPPWGLEVAIPLSQVAPLTRTLSDLAVVLESERYGSNTPEAKAEPHDRPNATSDLRRQ